MLIIASVPAIMVSILSSTLTVQLIPASVTKVKFLTNFSWYLYS
jgi:hypothetical protein